MKLLFKCKTCLKYTLEHEKCPWCGGTVVSAHPPPFSLYKSEKYSKYILRMLQEEYGEDRS